MRDIVDYEKKYIEEPFEETMADIRRRCVITQMGTTKGKNILEIGCGMHPLFLDVCDYKKMIVVEPSSDFVKNAEKVKENMFLGEKVEIIQGFLEEKIEELNHIDFDIIVLSSLLHELENPKIMLEAVRQICRDYTLVHINVPNAKSLHRLIAYESGMIPSVYERSAQQIKMQRYGTYDLSMLIKNVNSVGFHVISKGSYFIKPFTHAQMQKCLDEKIITEHALDGLEKLTKYLPEYGADIYVNVKKDM